jgi:hypothetical protein
MPLIPSLDPRYIDTLVMLKDALRALDELDEGIAAAQLCGVIDIVADRVARENPSRH